MLVSELANLPACINKKRFVSIGCPGRPFVTADPRLDDLLPVNDAAFNLGVRYSSALSSYVICPWLSMVRSTTADASYRQLNSTISLPSHLQKQGT